MLHKCLLVVVFALKKLDFDVAEVFKAVVSRRSNLNELVYMVVLQLYCLESLDYQLLVDFWSHVTVRDDALFSVLLHLECTL